ncbi:RNA polymerase sigma factor [Lawsonibacter hominis]|uniref:Sigma-70 family RNA polymerase sigma factor n=1 Tax=Lawsonibacter hominis TaxID=2763053 RepID=A0A8J6J1W8_9FIRM|nr:sigma-70 family RNA polymerase sigma factor [Lawsonibacter hominis]MBC5734722.1 sigma-70 family RNA polymerase sigma factor [Lawsonibacter hominis]
MIKKQEEGGGAGMTRKEEREWAWFDGQFRRHYSTMLRLTARQLRDPARAEELVQDAFELFWQKRAQLREHPNPGGWLMKTLQFLIRNEARSAGERLTQPLDGMALERAAAPPERREPLAEALPPGLAEGERALLIWFYEEERSCGEIAARLGISESLCRMRLTRARRRCRELWEAQGGPDGSGAKIF